MGDMKNRRKSSRIALKTTFRFQNDEQSPIVMDSSDDEQHASPNLTRTDNRESKPSHVEDSNTKQLLADNQASRATDTPQSKSSNVKVPSSSPTAVLTVPSSSPTAKCLQKNPKASLFVNSSVCTRSKRQMDKLQDAIEVSSSKSKTPMKRKVEFVDVPSSSTLSKKNKLESEKDMSAVDGSDALDVQPGRGRPVGSKKGKAKKTENPPAPQLETQEKVFRTLYSRSTTKPFYQASSSLSKAQKKAVSEMGFQAILDFSIELIPQRLAHYVVDRFDPDCMSIVLPNGRVEVNPDLIHRITGFPSGGIEILHCKKKDLKQVDQSRWLSFYGTKLVKPTTIRDRIVSTTKADWMFKVDFIMLLVCCLIDCNKSGECKLGILHQIEKTKSIKDLDWCRYTCSRLKRCKEGWRRDDPKCWFVGPLAVLVLIYVELTKSEVTNVNKEIPFSFWSFKKLRKREQSEIASGDFGLVELLGLTTRSENASMTDDMPIASLSKSHNSNDASSSRPSIQILQQQLITLNEKAKYYKDAYEEAVMTAIEDYPDETFWVEHIDNFADLFTLPKRSSSSEAAPCKDRTVDTADIVVNEVPDNEESGKDRPFNTAEISGNEVPDNQESGKVDESMTSSQFWHDPKVNEELLRAEAEAIQKTGGKDAKDRIKEKGKQPMIQYHDDDRPSFKLIMTQDFPNPQPAPDLSIESPALVPQPPPVQTTPSEVRLPLNDASFTTPIQVDDAVPLEDIDDPLDHIVLSARLPRSIDAKQSKGKEKRVKFKPFTLRSPYANRVVAIGRVPTASENRLWDLVFQVGASDKDIFFETEQGLKAERGDFLTLQPRGWVDESIIDCWVAVLNAEEKLRDKAKSPSRLFLPMSCMNYDMIFGYNDPLEEHVDVFCSNIDPFIKAIGSSFQWKDYDLIFIPACVGYHMFLLCFDMRTPCNLAIDNAYIEKDESKIMSCYRVIFATFLSRLDHPLADTYMTRKCKRLRMEWEAVGAYDDSGVFTMRHMETFKGIQGGKYNCGFDLDKEKQATQIRRLRCKYVTKIMLSSINKCKNKVLHEANECAKLNAMIKREQKLMDNVLG